MTASKLLFTPGPLSTSDQVKEAMLRDLGSRDAEFIALVRAIRERLVELAEPGGDAYEAVPMQGSGTFAIESVISSAIPRNGGLLVLVNGAYGRRIAKIARTLGITTVELACEEDQRIDPDRVATALARNSVITHVAAVHCETTTGIVNPVEEIGAVVSAESRVYLVDAMSSFGGIPMSVSAARIDFLVSSANKCIQGVPGFGFIIARRSRLLECEGRARSVSLDLLAQWKGLEADGQFRFTPPTHAVLAFWQALEELRAEGGVAARAARFALNQQVLAREMRAMGFDAYLPGELQSGIISTYRYPADPHFDFEIFYKRLSDRGFVIYPGKLTQAQCFRIGTIGCIYPGDVLALTVAIREVLAKLGVRSASSCLEDVEQPR